MWAKFFPWKVECGNALGIKWESGMRRWRVRVSYDSNTAQFTPPLVLSSLAFSVLGSVIYSYYTFGQKETKKVSLPTHNKAATKSHQVLWRARWAIPLLLVKSFHWLSGLMESTSLPWDWCTSWNARFVVGKSSVYRQPHQPHDRRCRPCNDHTAMVEEKPSGVFCSERVGEGNYSPPPPPPPQPP